MEVGEGDHDAMVRELREELGVVVTAVGDVRFEHQDEGSPFRIVFRTVSISGEPTALEHDDIRWATISELRQLTLAPCDHQFVWSRELLATEDASQAPVPPRRS